MNKNDAIEVTINLDGELEFKEENDDEIEESFYSLIILYKFEVVATKSYYYNKFAFRIWDIYNDFSFE